MLMVLLMACDGAGGETVDIVEGTYVGHPSEGTPEEGVTTPDPDTTFTIEFRKEGDELWADIRLHGTMVIHGAPVEDDDNTIEGVTVDGTNLDCSLTIDVFTFDVTGTFSGDFAALAIDVQHVGTMTLELVAEDTGAV